MEAQKKTNEGSSSEQATLGGGCFWCLEAVYQELDGILEVESGYSGGGVDNPTYRQVGTGSTGHAEVVQLTYDPQEISYRDILEVFFAIHDPTTLNRQGADVGPMYRSIILYHDQAQKAAAEEIINEMEAQKVWKNPIVTEVAPYQAFYIAEVYHQNYYRDNRLQPYCMVVINPNLSKFRKTFADKLKS